MASRHNFDYSEFRRGFQSACTRRGIDPVDGATSYEVVLVLADQQSASRPVDLWWQRNTIWVESPPFRSEVEEEAFWSLFVYTYIRLLNRILDAVRAPRADLPLRQLHQQHFYE